MMVLVRAFIPMIHGLVYLLHRQNLPHGLYPLTLEGARLRRSSMCLWGQTSTGHGEDSDGGRDTFSLTGIFLRLGFATLF